MFTPYHLASGKKQQLCIQHPGEHSLQNQLLCYCTQKLLQTSQNKALTQCTSEVMEHQPLGSFFGQIIIAYFNNNRIPCWLKLV